ncbi:MAG: DUF748 domain-containing protein [Desulfobacterales bacterium]
MNASAEVDSGSVKAIVDGLKVKLNHIAFSEAGNDNPLLSLDALGLNDGHIDIGSRAITITQVEAIGGGTNVVRDKDGRIQLLKMLDPGDKGKLKREIAETGSKARAEGKPWSLSLGTFDLIDFQVGLQDLTFVPEIVYNLRDIRASFKNLTNDEKTPIAFNTSLKVVQGGSASLSGQVSQIGDYADVRVKLTGVNIKPLHPAVTKFTSLALDSGNVSASTQVSYRASKPGPKLRANGSVNLNELRLNEADTSERFLEWKEMSANGIMFELSPNRLQVEELRLLEPGAKVVIFKNRSVNLAKVLKLPDAPNTGTKLPSAQTSTSTVEPQENQTLFPENIDRVGVEKGVVDFADFSLVLPFATQVTDFNGGISGISTKPMSRASLKFDGRVDKYGLSAMEGRFDPKMDSETLRTRRTRYALAEQMGVKLSPEEEPGPIAFDSVKTQKTLEKLLEMRSGDTAIADFKTQYEKATGKKAKRTNFAMAAIGWASSDTAFYQAMFKELVKLEPLTENDLKELALSRSEGIIKELKANAGLDDTRVTVGTPGPSEKVSTKTVNTQLTLDVIKPSA